jgi:tRNA threonylcarbamoyladenosine biosynthesis protein TsaB
VRPYLALDTSTALGSVAVGRGDRLLAEVVVGVTVRHSEALLPAIDYALHAAGVEPSGLGGVVVGGGPGSFTGVRVAGATAKGLIRVLGIPLFAYSGLQALAVGVGAASSRPVCALFDARRDEVYAACYGFAAQVGSAGAGSARIDAEAARAAAVETILEPVVLPVDEVLAELRGVGPIYAGDGALRYRDVIEGAGGVVAPAFQAAPRGGALLWLADVAPEAGLVEDPAGWEPEYLRAAGAERGAVR